MTWRRLVALVGVAAVVWLLAVLARNRTLSMRQLPAPTSAIEDLAARLERHVRELAGTIGPRYALRPRTLEAARSYIERSFVSIGYVIELQWFEAAGERVANVEASASTAARRESAPSPPPFIVIGAHYDTMPMTPGADDNASGVAALLEVARLMHGTPASTAIRFVAFVNEEPPWFQTPEMGSFAYAMRAKQRGDAIGAMISLESIGYYSDARGSQTYPPPFQLFFPSTGNFLAAVSNFRSFGLLRRFSRPFRAASPLPLIASPAPEAIAGISWSDHWAFWHHGYAALMLTDTALFRNPHYHEATDTPDTIDYLRLAYAVEGVAGAARELAQ